MIAYEITHLKDFMQKLLLSDTFDFFLVSRVSITTFAEFSISGELHPDFYDTEEADALKKEERKLVSWKEIRPFCLSVIRGTHTPLSFHIVFALSSKDTRRLLDGSGLASRAENVDGLFMNCRFQSGHLQITSGTSLLQFTPDKSVERCWDQTLLKFLDRIS